ncbi:hypothetical protein [Escherichia coli IS5]|nr:hypothetical protein [Escherichia coli IS5]
MTKACAGTAASARPALSALGMIFTVTPEPKGMPGHQPPE